MTVEVRVGDPDSLHRLEAALGDLTPVLDALGALLTARATATFRLQAKGQQPWPPRLTPNIPGIISDLNKGGDPKSRRFEVTPALIDTGTLRRSITWEVSGNGRVLTVGTSVPYASLHNEGGESKIKLTTEGRRKLSGWLRADKSRRRFGLGFLFSKPELTINVRRRQFLAIDSEDRQLIIDMVERGVGEQARGR